VKRPLDDLMSERPSLGMLLLDAPCLTIPGGLSRPSTFPVETAYRTVDGAAGLRVVGPDYAAVAGQFESTARELASSGAGFLTSNCGFAIAYQDDVQSATGLPTALSSLLLLPMLVRVYGGGVGVLTYDGSQFDEARRAAVGWPTDVDVPIADVQQSAAWLSFSNTYEVDGLDTEGMRRDLIETAAAFARQHSLRAILLECTGMCPFIADVRAATGLPTYDVVGLVHFLVMPEAWRERTGEI
jgi:hypothetical protein